MPQMGKQKVRMGKKRYREWVNSKVLIDNKKQGLNAF